MSEYVNLQPTNEVVRVIPLGGLGEVGMNCMLIEFDGEIIMIDCGQMMPDEEMLGIDSVIPDLTYVEQRKSRFLGIILTHAHEDHIGGLPHILPRFPNIPVYANELTAAIVREKLKEHGISPNFQIIEPRRKFRVGKSFEVEPITVTHSMIHSMAMAVRTPLGVLIHSGDYKMDPNPPDGSAFDFYAFQRYAEGEEEGVLCLMGDSTNVDRRGNSPSETEVIRGLDQIFSEAEQTIIFSCFASSLHRIQTVLNLAAKHGRKVFASGLNMERNIRIASQLKAIDISCEYSDDLRNIESVPRAKRLILSTGSQGESLAGLFRMAVDNHRHVSIEEGDTVVLSTRFIPGNEKAIFKMINHISRRGANVFHEGSALVHVSGHAYRDEMRHLINLTNPLYLVPIHGEYRHLKAHRALAIEQGMPAEDAIVLDNGDCLELNSDEANIVGKVPHGRVLVDGKGVGDVQEVVLRDRLHLSQDGFVIVVMAIDRDSGEIVNGPDISTRGFIHEEANEALLKDLREEVMDAYGECSPEMREDEAAMQAAVKKALRTHIKKRLGRFPIILPCILEV